MAIKDLVPRFGHGRERRLGPRQERDPFHAFQREMNRLFDDFFGAFEEPGFGLLPGTRGGGLPLAGAFNPRVDVAETDKAVKVTAELPGLDEKDVSVELTDTALTLRGERREEKEDRGKDWTTRELSYGAFHRVIPLPSGVDAGKAKARFRKGLLTVTVPRQEGGRPARQAIAIESD